MDRVRDISVELGRGAQHHKAQEVPKKQARQSSTDGTNAHIASEQDVIMAYSLILGREPEIRDRPGAVPLPPPRTLHGSMRGS